MMNYYVLDHSSLCLINITLLLNHSVQPSSLRSAMCKFTHGYNDLVCQYNLSVGQMLYAVSNIPFGRSLFVPFKVRIHDRYMTLTNCIISTGDVLTTLMHIIVYSVCSGTGFCPLPSVVLLYLIRQYSLLLSVLGRLIFYG